VKNEQKKKSGKIRFFISCEAPHRHTPVYTFTFFFSLSTFRRGAVLSLLLHIATEPKLFG
jgi:hypothetical protein